MDGRYNIFIDNKAVIGTDEWGEAHEGMLQQHTLETTGLSIYVSLDGKPIWGNTPEEQAKPAVKHRLAVMRCQHLKKLQSMPTLNHQEVPLEDTTLDTLYLPGPIRRKILKHIQQREKPTEQTTTRDLMIHHLATYPAPVAALRAAMHSTIPDQPLCQQAFEMAHTLFYQTHQELEKRLAWLDTNLPEDIVFPAQLQEALTWLEPITCPMDGTWHRAGNAERYPVAKWNKLIKQHECLIVQIRCLTNTSS